MSEASIAHLVVKVVETSGVEKFVEPSEEVARVIFLACANFQ